MARRHDPAQQSLLPALEGAEAERRALIRGAIGRLAEQGLVIRSGVARDLEELLTYLSRCGGDDADGSQVRVWKIAQNLRLPERTAIRRLKLARELGLVESEVRLRHGHNRLCWSRIRELAIGGPAIEHPTAPPIGHGDKLSPHAANLSPRGDKLAAPIIAPLNPSQPPPPAPAEPRLPARPAGQPGDAATWREAEEALEVAGVKAAGKAAATARRRGVEARFVVALVQFASGQADRWESLPAAIYTRVVTATAGETDPSAGWPAANARHERRVSIERSEVRRDRQRAVVQSQRSAVDEDRQRLDQLERLHGGHLDALPRSERDALALAIWPAGSVMWDQYRLRGAVGFVRLELLERLALPPAEVQHAG